MTSVKKLHVLRLESKFGSVWEFYGNSKTELRMKATNKGLWSSYFKRTWSMKTSQELYID